jgi:putative serine/threonine protein kinase
MELMEEIAKKVKELSFLAKGKRGMVYTGYYKGKKVAVKLQRADIKAILRIKNEGDILSRINKYNIGPRLLFYTEEYMIYTFVEGDFIVDFLDENGRDKIKKILIDIFAQLNQLDKLKIDKEEMHHPVKHVIIAKKAVLIDFERAHFTEKPKNVTQFIQFIVGPRVSDLLKKKGIKIKKEQMLSLAREYKSSYGKSTFNSILAIIKKA